MGISFLFKAVRGSNANRFYQHVKQIADRSGKGKILVASDLLWCSFRYGAGPMDYALFEFDRKPARLRRTYITRGINNKMVKKYNPSCAWKAFDDKANFNRQFAPYIRRGWVETASMTPTDFAELCDGKEELLYKPINGTCGKGIHKVSLDRPLSILFDHYKAGENALLEEIVRQHPAMSALYPHAINTVRVMTLYRDGVCVPLFAFLRIGNGGGVVDNLNSGGMAARLTLADGRVTQPAADKNGNTYETHPMTGHPIVGFAVPHWEQVLATCAEAAALTPQVGYVGWDICVRDEDVLLIEGNGYPGHDILQLPAYTPDGIGLLSHIKPYL